MIPVREISTDTFVRLVGDQTLDSLDGTRRAPLATILHDSWSAQERAAFGVFLATPFVVPQGKIKSGEPRFVREAGEVKQVFDVADPPPPSAEEVRQGVFAALPDRADLMTRLQTATPQQIDNWIDGNVTNIATARAVLKAIIKVMVANSR